MAWWFQSTIYISKMVALLTGYTLYNARSAFYRSFNLHINAFCLQPWCSRFAEIRPRALFSRVTATWCLVRIQPSSKNIKAESPRMACTSAQICAAPVIMQSRADEIRQRRVIRTAPGPCPARAVLLENGFQVAVSSGGSGLASGHRATGDQSAITNRGVSDAKRQPARVGRSAGGGGIWCDIISDRFRRIQCDLEGHGDVFSQR